VISIISSSIHSAHIHALNLPQVPISTSFFGRFLVKPSKLETTVTPACLGRYGGGIMIKGHRVIRFKTDGTLQLNAIPRSHRATKSALQLQHLMIKKAGDIHQTI
jgi:hypothetical protein